MKILYNGIAFAAIRDREFGFEGNADVAGLSLPISSFTAIVKSATNDIVPGTICELIDDEDNDECWLRGFVKSATEEGYSAADSAYYIKVVVEDALSMLDERTLPAKMFRQSSLFTQRRFLTINVLGSDLAPHFDLSALPPDDDPDDPDAGDIGADIFFPQQTARERLQMFCAAFGYYVQTMYPDDANTEGDQTVYYGRLLEAPTRPSSTVEMPTSIVYRKPQIKSLEIYDDTLPNVYVKSYEYIGYSGQNTPPSGAQIVLHHTGAVEQWVEQREFWSPQEPNPDARNIVIDKCSAIIHGYNDTDARNRASIYFVPKNAEAFAEIRLSGLHTGAFIAFSDGDKSARGFIGKLIYKFGKAKKAKVTLSYAQIYRRQG